MWPPGRDQFWPQGHNLNNFGRGPLDDAIYTCTKYESCGPCTFRQEDFWKLHYDNLFFWPCDLLMQPTGTIWTTLIGDHPGIIPVKFGQNPMSGFRGEVV